MSSNSVAPASARSISKISRHRILPVKEERSFVPISLNSAMDLNLELFCLLTRQPKNGLVQEILDDFLSSRRNSCKAAQEQTFPSHKKNRVTFVISKDLQKRLDAFVERTGFHQSCVLTAALIEFMKTNRIDPYLDPSDRVLRQLQGQRVRRDPKSTRAASATGGVAR